MKRIAMVFILALALPTAVTAQVVLFSDDFNNGMRSEWGNPDGGWVAENGHLRVKTACGFQQCNPDLYAGGALQSDYVVSFDFLITEAFTYHGSSVHCDLAMTNPVEPAEGPTSGYNIQFGWSPDGTPANANCGILRIDNSAETGLGVTSGAQFWIVPNVIYHMRAGRIGSQLVVKKWTDGDPEPDWQLSVTDTTYRAGYFMPSFWNQVGWIDNVVVEGLGAVPAESASWGSVKSLFR